MTNKRYLLYILRDSIVTGLFGLYVCNSTSATLSNYYKTLCVLGLALGAMCIDLYVKGKQLSGGDEL